MKIKAVIPTRGLVFARTLISLQNNGIYDFVIVNGLPIPFGHNRGVEEALKDSKCTHVLMVEDDMEIPGGAVGAMVKLDKSVVCIDYPMDNGYSTITRQGGKTLWCGLGCTLVKRGVFEQLASPWFDNSQSVKLHGVDGEGKFSWEVIDNPNKYGGHDIMFGVKLLRAGIKIFQLPGFEAKHLRCESLSRGEKNDGQFIIESLAGVSKRTEY